MILTVTKFRASEIWALSIQTSFFNERRGYITINVYPGDLGLRLNDDGVVIETFCYLKFEFLMVDLKAGWKIVSINGHDFDKIRLVHATLGKSSYELEFSYPLNA